MSCFYLVKRLKRVLRQFSNNTISDESIEADNQFNTKFCNVHISRKITLHYLIDKATYKIKFFYSQVLNIKILVFISELYIHFFLPSKNLHLWMSFFFTNHLQRKWYNFPTSRRSAVRSFYSGNMVIYSY